MLKALERIESAPSYLEESYILQRKGMAWLGLVFPVVFILSSLFGRTEFQASISAYYWTLGFERNFFVGALFAIGTFLLLYKGASSVEDRLLDVAGVCAVCVAFVPMIRGSDLVPSGLSPHGFFAVAFFACIAVYCVSMTFFTPPREAFDLMRRKRFRKFYLLCTIAIVVAVAIAWVLHSLGRPIFLVEAVAVWAFSAFWYFKTRELDPSQDWVPWILKQRPEVATAT